MLTDRRVLALLVAAAIAEGCGEGEGVRPASPAGAGGVDGPPTIDERRGTYRDVGLESTRRQAMRRFGRIRAGIDQPFAPLGKRPLEVGIPPAPRDPPGLDPAQIWRFRDAAIVADRGRAWMIVVSARDARTRRRVGVGSSLAAVRRAYGRARCDIANEGTEYVRFRYCTLRVAPGRHVWFAYDPVRSVTMSKAPMEPRSYPVP